MARTRRLATLILTLLAPLAAAPAALAVPDCPGPHSTRAVLSGQGVLEAAIVDAQGRLFYSDTTLKAVMRMDSPGSAPVVLASGIESPGGLAFAADGALVAGEGNGFVNGAIGNVSPRSRLLRLDPDTGAKSVFAEGLAMANGLVRAPDGGFFASDDAGLHIDRVSPGGQVDNRFARVISPNGLAIDPTGTWLYAAQTFQPAAIARVEIANPENVEVYASPGPADIAAGPDGMDSDSAGRLYVAANGAGEVWRVDTDRSICALARGLLFPSAVAVGRGPAGFSGGRLYVVTFSGVVAEIDGI